MGHARELIGAGAKALIERGFALSGKLWTPSGMTGCSTTFIAHYGQNLRVHSTLFDGIEQALDRLDADGFIFAVCTNKIEKHRWNC